MLTGWSVDNEARVDAGQGPLALAAYLRSGHFISATFENWESEFLQMGMYVLLTVWLRQRGSAESRPLDPAQEQERIEPGPTPWPVRAGATVRWLYAHSLTLAFLLLFLGSFAMHGWGSWVHENDERGAAGKPPIGLVEHLGGPRFWFESFQNWQSEFVAVLSIVLLSIWLRHGQIARVQAGGGATPADRRVSRSAGDQAPPAWKGPCPVAGSTRNSRGPPSGIFAPPQSTRVAGPSGSSARQPITRQCAPSAGTCVDHQRMPSNDPANHSLAPSLECAYTARAADRGGTTSTGWQGLPGSRRPVAADGRCRNTSFRAALPMLLVTPGVTAAAGGWRGSRRMGPIWNAGPAVDAAGVEAHRERHVVRTVRRDVPGWRARAAPGSTAPRQRGLPGTVNRPAGDGDVDARLSPALHWTRTTLVAPRTRGIPPMKPRSIFNNIAKKASHAAGTPWVFCMAMGVVVVWACSGPLFGFNDTWQLVINTGTTIITFLMVFLIQHTQNADTTALHLKLDELIRVTRAADNTLLNMEELDEKELEALRRKYEALADKAARREVQKPGDAAEGGTEGKARPPATVSGRG